MINRFGLNKTEHYILNNGVEIPAIAFGTYKAADGKSADVIRLAIEAGYRYFDTASFYGTETYLAQAVRESEISRDKIFIASKLWKTEMGYENVKYAFERSLDKLNTDYLDLYLIHWPVCRIRNIKTGNSWTKRRGGQWKNYIRQERSGLSA